MTITEAQEELKTANHVWLDFDYWACLQLYARGLDGKEYVKKMQLVRKLHAKREAELKAFQENLHYEDEKMEQAGATCEEINAFYRSRDKELQRLMTAWRSLD
jgi:hypothetical protein